MVLDAIIISDSGVDSLSGTNPLRFTLQGRTADVQVVANYLSNQGKLQMPIAGDGIMNWASAFKLNGIFLFSYLARQGYEVELINGFYAEKDRFTRLMQCMPRAVIVSTTFIPGKQVLRKLVDDIRALAPDVFIIAGGPLIYLSHLLFQKTYDRHYDTQSAKNEFLFLSCDAEPAVDLYVISLRGETILVNALDALRKAKPLSDLPNTVRLEGDRYCFSQRINDSKGDDNFSIDWESVPDDVFHSGVVPLQASVGCLYDCAFCNFSKEHRLTNIKPIDQLVAELKAVSRRGAKYVWFTDDNFRLGKGDLNAVCRRFIDEGIDVKWMTFARASMLRHADIPLLKQAGCIEVQLGLESADPQILKNMNKKADPDLYSGVLKRLLAAGINCSCYFIYGFPGETSETVSRTREFIKNHAYSDLEGSLSWSIYPFILSPLSPIYEPAMREKYNLAGYLYQWDHRTMNSDQARAHIVDTFFKLDNSGPIYRGDNQDMMRYLGPSGRKQFETARHRLSKDAAKGHLKTEDVLNAFRHLFPETPTTFVQ